MFIRLVEVGKLGMTTKTQFYVLFNFFSRGQLGLGELEDELTPQLIEALAGIKIATIAAGMYLC